MASDETTLPPLPDEAFDGVKETADIPSKGAFSQRCAHKNVSLVQSARIVRCQCGAEWQGFGAEKLFEAFKKQ